MIRRKNISALIDEALTKADTKAFRVDEQNLFSLIVLMVDIQYRHRYGNSLDYHGGRGYMRSGNINNKVPPGRQSPFDLALEGNQREFNDGQKRSS